jgi:acyl-coenzyme A thioesterase PaaI-like protein
MIRAMQDVMPVRCFGCGALNEHGLHIKSFWAGEDVVCAWRPESHHIGHPGILYGGMIASVVDCHCIWTATAHAHRAAGIEMDETPRFPYVTATLTVSYRKPVPIDNAIDLCARGRVRRAQGDCQVHGHERWNPLCRCPVGRGAHAGDAACSRRSSLMRTIR